MIESGAAPEQVAAVAEAFARAGFEVEVDPSYERRSVDLLPWVVLIELRVQTKPFFDAFLTEAGKSIYAAIKFGSDKSPRRTRERVLPKAKSGSVTRTEHLVLPSPLADEAIEALRDLDYDEIRGDYLVWDAARKVWRDPTKREQSAETRVDDAPGRRSRSRAPGRAVGPADGSHCPVELNDFLAETESRRWTLFVRQLRLLSARLAVEAKDEVFEVCELVEPLLDGGETVVHTGHRLGQAVDAVVELVEAVVVLAELGCDRIRRLTAAAGLVRIEHARGPYRVPRCGCHPAHS